MHYHKLLFIGLSMAMMTLQSCLDEDSNTVSNFPDALVTVKTDANDKTYFQLDESTKLFPENLTTKLYDGKEVRALVSYNKTEKVTEGYDQTVLVNWVDSIRTKDVALLEAGETLDKYGKDPIDIVDDWVTVLEDGYLTLRLRTVWGTVNRPHEINLVGNLNPDDPYEVALCHDAKGDTQGRYGDALIAFRLKNLAPDAQSVQRLTIKWKAMNGEEKKATISIKAVQDAEN